MLLLGPRRCAMGPAVASLPAAEAGLRRAFARAQPPPGLAPMLFRAEGHAGPFGASAPAIQCRALLPVLRDASGPGVQRRAFGRAQRWPFAQAVQRRASHGAPPCLGWALGMVHCLSAPATLL